MDDDEHRGYRKERPLADIIPPDRRRLRAAALVLGGMAAGAALFALIQGLTTRRDPPPIVALEHATRVRAFDIGPSTADITSARPGAVSPDGRLDQAFDLVVDGPITGIVVVSCDSAGRPFGTHRWGTVDYDPAIPDASLAGMRAAPGWQLAVFETTEPRNDPTGALRPFGEGTHRLRIYASDSSAFHPGSYFRAYVIGRDDEISASEPLAFTGHGPPERADDAPASPSFDRRAAAAALAAVNLKPCESVAGVDGPGHVTLTFANDGFVSHVEIDRGGNEKTPRGACIERAFKTVRVYPFAGAPIRVGKSFTINPAR